ncbi:MAG: response regulator [Deltaproteobacteria bacterium]|nr:response regulator [Deltaproteobacteria bacterium]MBF0525620.1 response regulator [Deltaproteobacteria bacterium]
MTYAVSEWKVLLIDDDDSIRKVLSITLRDAGYQVWEAPNGEAGLEVFLAVRPDIVLTDLKMPGLDGIAVLQQIKSLDSDKEVIVITAHVEIDTAIQALQLGASDFIMKPVSDMALEVALKRAQERLIRNRKLHEYTELLEKRWLDTAEELAKISKFQDNLIESSIDGIIGCDPGGKVIIFNRSSELMLGYHKKDVIHQKSLKDFFAPADYQDMMHKLLSPGLGGPNRVYLYETHLINQAGAQVPVQFSGAVLTEGELEIGLVGFFKDLWQLRKLEQEFADQTRLLHQDKMISLGRLAASMVHEINNPLTGTLNYIRLMKKITAQGPIDGLHQQKFKNYLELMESETNRCSKIVSNLLAFSRKPLSEFRCVKINDVLEKCVIMSQHNLQLSNVELITKFHPTPPLVWGDDNQLQQTVINLILNALDSMPQGGRLTLESDVQPVDQTVLIKVSDTGCGIAKEDLDHIFEPFFTTKTEGKGLGLGLSVVYGIVDRHRGAVEVQTSVNKGTVFKIKLPSKQNPLWS